MIPFRTPFRIGATAALVSAALGSLALLCPATLAAQAMIQSLEPNDADRLAAQMRMLAANPQDITALATAGELSLRLGDLSGAAALFARADKVDPRNGRVKAGMAAVLVRSERPGEALRFFDQAAGYGWPVERFAADRGLAYDLIGQNDRAQRDYRLALQHGRDDETVRRYALSLGIAGKRAEALAQLDPLVRRQDRAGWRAQAFVLAMTGDTPGAAKIATAMMPAAMNQGLGAFFQRLPTLSATDRAFAVHFGEIYATPERLADARLTPALAPLVPEPVAAPVQVAAVEQPDRRNRRQRDRDRRRDVQMAAVQPKAAPIVRMAPPREVVQALPGRTALPISGIPAGSASVMPVTVARATPVPASTAAIGVPVTVAGAGTTSQTMRETNVRVEPATAAGVGAPALASVPPVRPATPVPPAIAAVPAVAPVAIDAPPPVAVVLASPIVHAPAAPVELTAAKVATTSPVVPVPSVAAADRADAVLARIVANLSIPATELGIEPVRPDPAPVVTAVPAAVERAPASAAGKRVVAEAAAKEARDGVVRRVAAARLAGDGEIDEAPAARGRTRGGRRGAAPTVEPVVAETPVRARSGRRAAVAQADDIAVDPVPRTRGGRTSTSTTGESDVQTRTRRGGRVADTDVPPLDPKAKRAADRKALADKKVAADKKALVEQAAADRKVARANPARIWVQVAGGANEGDLGKAWSSAKAKAPALVGKVGYATPLRATNRVLTGPFKTDAEARAFVNQLKKQGVAGFSFTSDAGQEVTKLGGK